MALSDATAQQFLETDIGELERPADRIDLSHSQLIN